MDQVLLRQLTDLLELRMTLWPRNRKAAVCHSQTAP